MKLIFNSQIIVFTVIITLLYNLDVDAQNFTDNFDSYNSGQQLCLQTTEWQTRTGGIDEDPYISSLYKYSGENSCKIVPLNDLLKLHNKQTGKWYISFWFYIPSGKVGYFNILNAFPAPWGSNYGMAMIFQVDGWGSLDIGFPVPFNWQVDAWNQIIIVIDLDTHIAEVRMGLLVETWDWTRNGTLPNFIAATGFTFSGVDNEMYIDDYYFGDAMPQLANDVGTDSIKIPSQIPLCEFSPEARVKNFGTDMNTFDVVMRITPGNYLSTRQVLNLGTLTSAIVQFDTWNPTAGVYTVNVCTQLTGDLNIANDCLEKVVMVSGSINTFQLTVDIAALWNMVSIPGLHLENQSVNTWWFFRDRGTNVVKFNGGWIPVNEVTPGVGYWMKHDDPLTYNTGDEWPVCGIQIVPHDPIASVAGWNMIGGYEIAATATLVTTVPSGQQSGPIYKYSGGYQVATTLDPGYGYWIKLLSDCQIIIPETLAKDGKPVEWFPEDWGRIILSDATGVSYTLYAVKGEVDLSQYELPPAPMEGMYDFRFSSGRIAEDINSSVKTIDMSGVTYPLTLRVEGVNMRLMDETGMKINENVKDGEAIVISDAQIGKLMVSGELLPTVYALQQNYPNPFNPSTKIKFSIAKEGQVSLCVFNILGEQVKELKNEMMKPGYYDVEFNASNLASGVYLYRIKAGDFIESKKMVLMK